MINETIIRRVDSPAFPFIEDDLKAIQLFATYVQGDEPAHFSRKETGLKRSIMMIPFSGTYILCKGKGSCEEIPLGIPTGGWNRATIAIHCETGVKLICRSGPFRTNRTPEELKIVQLVNEKKMQRVLGGVIVEYYGKLPEPFPPGFRKDKGERNVFPPDKLERVGLESIKKIALLLPFCEKGELFAFKGRTSFLLNYIKDAALGIKECHDNGIVHNDVKPENIFLKGDRAFLGDMGNSFMVKEVHLHKIPFSKGFIPPECLSYSPEYDARARDLWQLGLTIIDKYYNQTIVKKIIELYGNINSIEEFITLQIESYKKVPVIPLVVHTLATKLLSIDPKKRGTIDEVLALL